MEEVLPLGVHEGGMEGALTLGRHDETRHCIRGGRRFYHFLDDWDKK